MEASWRPWSTARAWRRAGRALMIDLDHFKNINDSFGHDAGDDVLREFAVRLASNVGRWICPAAMAARSSW
jgi:diguanylate cyclase (GGDEF)-like protein